MLILALSGTNVYSAQAVQVICQLLVFLLFPKLIYPCSRERKDERLLLREERLESV